MIDLALIAVPLTVHLGRLTDSFWPKARQGQTVIAEHHAGTVTSAREGAIIRSRKASTIGGYHRVFILAAVPDSIPDRVIRKSVLLVLIVDEIAKDTLMFTTRIHEEDDDDDPECSVFLPEGTYSFYCFILDGRSPTIDNARLYGLGVPFHRHIFDGSHPEDTGDLHALMMEAPFDVQRGGPNTLQLLVLDTAEFAGLPHTFGEYLVGIDGLLTGQWRIQETIDGGTGVVTSVDLIQRGRELVGTAITAVIEDESATVAQRLLGGAVDEIGRFELTSRHARILNGPSNVDVGPVAWSGVIHDVDTLVGHSLDAAGRAGEFVMTRQAA